ncbi:Hsp70 family protein [Pedobacter sp. KR3-3]|uniref:Hsp70 family protein n=1 Tax=Pedobacter albus TaxID=3113905 RepID=A0ABU7ICX1_9SPHI|nr:Hsp70 family protein [Pedobacter sp. KR3-3]MEE1947322.1 Hsp70 family protein [Pedobacter sp. KR3-3]
MENINFGIDLGTTNSGIGKFEAGKVNIYKNPVGFREVLPSVVAYRNGRILVGDKARELTTMQPEHVFSSFKRKMGSEHNYFVSATNENKTAIDFSVLVLKELLSFVGTPKPTAAVITIPASFGTVQSNATKTAGYQAGLEEVVLLQEPIAACLAYANTQNLSLDQEKKWLVYDFGGGTFDVALVRINHRELRVLDHEGNNFLGGLDIDNLMLEHLFCPVLEQQMGITNLWKQMVGADAPYYKLFVELLYKAEEAKKELSLKEEVYVELDMPEGFIEFPISRQAFNQLIEQKVEETIKLTKSLLNKNQIEDGAIERIVLVGGTTYIPYVRETLQQQFNTIVDSSIDPSTAIMVGASYYAGTKNRQPKEIKIEAATAPAATPTVPAQEIKLVYEVNSQDAEELITGVLANNFSGYYRLTRTDGGFDTGLIAFHSKFNEFVKLVPKAINQFQLRVFDKFQQMVLEKTDISINHGLYNISGQPLPNDICLEIDDTIGTTYLERIFKKNDILPLSKKIYKTASKTIMKGSGEQLVINVVEGLAAASPASNVCIGYIEISAEELPANLLKGTDIEISFKVSESRDLIIDIFISSIGLEINQVFNATSRQVSVRKIQAELENALQKIERDGPDLIDTDSMAQTLEELRITIIELLEELIHLEDDFITDKIYNLDERKIKLLQQVDGLLRNKELYVEIEEYQGLKTYIREHLLLNPDLKIDQVFQTTIKNEAQFLNSGQLSLIKAKIRDLHRLVREIYYQNDDSYIELFYQYSYIDADSYQDPDKLKVLIERGQIACTKKDYTEVKAIISQMYNLLKVKPEDSLRDQNGTLGLK